MKAVYLIWPDEKYIEKLINAGIDTLIVANLDSQNDKNPAGFWGSWPDTLDVLNKYRNDPRVNIIFAPIWVRYWENLPKDQQFFDGERYHQTTPCPTSKEFVQSRFTWANYVAGRWLTDVAFDTEAYTDVKSLYRYKGIFKRDRCECDRCKDKSTWAQYKEHKKNIQAASRELHMCGQFPYSKWWVTSLWHKKSDQRLFFDESTYDGIEFKHKKRAFWRKLFTGTKTVAGIWCEKMTPDEILEQIEIVNNSKVFDGYWLYAHARFSRTAWVREDEYLNKSINPYYLNVIDKDDATFFNRLKERNE